MHNIQRVHRASHGAYLVSPMTYNLSKINALVDARSLLWLRLVSFRSCCTELPSFGQLLSLISFHHTASMAILVFSSTKPSITAPQRAHRCIVAAISRISANKKTGLRWVLLYVPSFPFFPRRLFPPSGRATTKAEASCCSITPFADLARTGLPSQRFTFIRSDAAMFSRTEGKSGNWVVAGWIFRKNVRP